MKLGLHLEKDRKRKKKKVNLKSKIPKFTTTRCSLWQIQQLWRNVWLGKKYRTNSFTTISTGRESRACDNVKRCRKDVEIKSLLIYQAFKLRVIM